MGVKRMGALKKKKKTKQKQNKTKKVWRGGNGGERQIQEVQISILGKQHQKHECLFLTLPKMYSQLFNMHVPSKQHQTQDSIQLKKYKCNHGAVVLNQLSKLSAVPQLQDSCPNRSLNKPIAYPTSMRGLRHVSDELAFNTVWITQHTD